MGRIRQSKQARLFAGMLAPETALFDRCAAILGRRFGPGEWRSRPAPWPFSDHYADELGPDILRSFIFFDRLIDEDELAEIKVFANHVEEELAVNGDGRLLRRVNIDPGYLTEAKVVLATTKDYAHQICIGSGIYAETALIFRGSSFRALEHTYPDFRTGETIAMFTEARRRFRRAVHPA